MKFEGFVMLLCRRKGGGEDEDSCEKDRVVGINIDHNQYYLPDRNDTVSASDLCMIARSDAELTLTLHRAICSCRRHVLVLLGLTREMLDLLVMEGQLAVVDATRLTKIRGC